MKKYKNIRAIRSFVIFVIKGFRVLKGSGGWYLHFLLRVFAVDKAYQCVNFGGGQAQIRHLRRASHRLRVSEELAQKAGIVVVSG
jgi:hypothetical protein